MWRTLFPYFILLCGERGFAAPYVKTSEQLHHLSASQPKTLNQINLPPHALSETSPSSLKPPELSTETNEMIKEGSDLVIYESIYPLNGFLKARLQSSIQLKLPQSFVRLLMKGSHTLKH